MKKHLIYMALMAVAVLPACSKHNTDSVGDNTYNSSAAREYLMYIVDDLVTDVLDQAEKALIVNSRDVRQSIQFDTREGAFDAPGVTWTVTADDSPLPGMTFTCQTPDKWQASFDGKYAFDEDIYPTRFIMTLEKGQKYFDTHYAGTISRDGRRTERGGYACTFTTEPQADYGFSNGGSSFHGWDYLFGQYCVTIYRDSKPIDIWLFKLKGGLSKAEFIRQL